MSESSASPRGSGAPSEAAKHSEPFAAGRVDYLVVGSECKFEVPTLLLLPALNARTKRPVVVMLAQSGTSALLKPRADVFALLLESGVAGLVDAVNHRVTPADANDAYASARVA